MKLAPREQRAIRMGVIGAILIVIYILVVDPAWSRWTEVSQKLATVRSQIQQAKAGAASAVEEFQLRRELVDAARLASDATPLNEHTALLIQQVEQLPHYDELHVTRIEGLAAREEEDYVRTGVSLQFSGGLTALQGFLADLSAAHPTLIVDRMSLSTHSKNVNQVEGTMVIFGFSVPEPKAETSTDKKRPARSINAAGREARPI